jgi:hypothetical protein
MPLAGELPDWFLILQMKALHPLAPAPAVVILANGLGKPVQRWLISAGLAYTPADIEIAPVVPNGNGAIQPRFHAHRLALHAMAIDARLIW